MRKKKRDTFARSAMKLLCTLLGLILAVMLALTFGFQYLLDQIGTAPEEPSSGGLLQMVSQTVQNGTLTSLSLGESRNTVNILLIGQDHREGETAQARSDSMILCSFHKDTDELTMTSILRDLYVPIPGHHDNRINAAYSYGGMSLLKQTIEENFGISIQGCVEVDFSQFSQIVEVLGGVELELRQDEADYINKETGSSLRSGLQRLSGPEALTYSRIRSLDADSDFSRTNRQRKVLTAIFNGYRQANVSQLLNLVREVLPMITTNLNRGQLVLLAAELAPHLSGCEINSQRIPADGTFTDQTIDGMAVLVADMEKNRLLLQKTTE